MSGITGRTPNGYTYGNYPGGPLQPVQTMQQAQTMPGYQQAGYGWPGMPQGGMNHMMPQATQAQMSKPTVHADIIQVESEAAAEKEPVDAGTSQMMITKDESAIMIKSVLANGETTMDIYRKQPKAVKKPEVDYITREEFEQRIAEMLWAEKEKRKPVLRVVETDMAEDIDAEDDAPAKRTAPRRPAGGKKE